jgi:NTE family protein
MKVAVACQGGGMHAAFEVGVLKAILEHIQKTSDQKKTEPVELVGLSGTSAGALCALMVWYGLECLGSADKAIRQLEDFWEDFVAKTSASTLLNLLSYGAFRAEEIEIPVLGISPRVFGLNPSSAMHKAVTAFLPALGVRKKYFDLMNLLEDACPDLKTNSIDWKNVKTRLLIGASEVVNGFEAVFDSDVNKGTQHKEVYYWRQRLPLTLSGVAASGTLPIFREAEHIKGDGHYWDGLYSQNPPVREFLAGADEIPDELWIVRINPQQWSEVPQTNAEIQDRQNELMGNLSLNKELDFILTVNKWRERYGEFANDHKHVTVRTIKMEEKKADELRYSSKFNRSRDFMDRLRKEGGAVARDWLNLWPEHVGCYPEDAAYYKFQTTVPKPRLPKKKPRLPKKKKK